jgi:ABC-type branched-subunit amino acid transport system substrate-binding protein
VFRNEREFTLEQFVHKWKEVAMETKNDARRYGGWSLGSVMLTAVATTVNHWYTLGAGAFVLGAVLLAVPAALWWGFRRTQSRIALLGYVLMNAWIVVGFGLMKGFWEGVLPLFIGTPLAAHSTIFPKPTFGTAAFELSGLLMFIGSLFVLNYGYRFMQTTHGSDAHAVVAPKSSWVIATSGFVVATGLATVWAATDRDRWVPPSNGVVRIGIIVPTSGPYAILGNSFVKAAQMALDDLHDTTYRYRLVIKDSGPDPAKAPAIIRRVMTEDQVNAIVGGVSIIGQVTKPYATKARIPHLCVCTVSAIADGAYNFTNIPSPEAEATLWVREAQRRGIKRVAVLSQDYPSINNHVRALRTEAGRVGLRVVDEQRFEESVVDFRAQIARAEAAGPDLLYIEAFNPALDRLGQQLADADVRRISSVVAPSVSERPELFEGVWYTDSNLREFAFKRRFEDKYPDAQFATHMMPYAYDSVQMIVQAFERGENPAVYLRDLHTYEGTAGTLTKRPGSGHFESTPTVWVIRNGKPALAY